MTRPIAESALDLLWSLWTELGVPGGERHHDEVALDIEPLVAFTPHLAQQDPRLLGLARDWCRLHKRWISSTRLEGLSRSLPETVRARLQAFREEFDQPGADGRKIMALPTDRPAMVHVRIRALVGVGTRADVIARLLAARGQEMEVEDLQPEGTTRRSVERCLADFAQGGIVEIRGARWGRKFVLPDWKALTKTLAAGGLRWPRWGREFAVVVAMLELEQAATSSSGLQGLAAQRFREDVLGSGSSILANSEPPAATNRYGVFENMRGWASHQIGRIASGEAFAGSRLA